MSSNKKVIPFKKNANPKVGGGLLKYIGLAIVALAVLSLLFSSLFSGISGFGSGNLVFGRYGNKNIVYNYDNSFGRSVISRMEETSNEQDPDGQYFNFLRRMIWQQEFSNAVVRIAVTYHLEQAGYKPSTKSVDSEIINDASFRTNNRFDEEKYRNASASAKDALREILRENIALNTWTSDSILSIRRSDAQLDFLSSLKETIHSYDYIVLPYSDYPDEDVLVYAGENAQLFRTRPVSRMTVEDEETAREMIALFNERRQDIDAFAALAREYSTDSFKEDGGSIGSTEYHTLLELISVEDADAVFTIDSGEIAGPFESEYGWIVFHTDGEVEEANLEGSIADIRNYMLKNDVGIVEDNLLAKAEDYRNKVVAANSFRGAMSAEGLEVKSTISFPFNYGGDALLGNSPEQTDDLSLAGTTSSEDFWRNIVALEKIGEVSQPIVLSEAIGLFALATVETQEKDENWSNTVSNDLNSTVAEQLQSIILAEDSKLLDDNFSETYDKIYQDQG